MITENLITAVLRGIHRFRMGTGIDPTAIYMGHSTFTEFRKDPDVRNAMVGGTIHAERPKFDGLPIYLVNEDHYLGVGMGGKI